MANQKITANHALLELEKMASEYSSYGYTIEWTYYEFDSVDEEIYGELFNV
jgi:hypothetical protein